MLAAALTISPLFFFAIPGTYAKGGGGHKSHTSGGSDTGGSSNSGESGTSNGADSISGGSSGSSSGSSGSSYGSGSGTNNPGTGSTSNSSNNHHNNNNSQCVVTSAVPDSGTASAGYTTYTTACSSRPSLYSSQDLGRRQSKELSSSAIAGIVIGSVAGVAIIAFALWYLLRRQKRNTRLVGDKKISIAAPEGTESMSKKAYEALEHESKTTIVAEP